MDINCILWHFFIRTTFKIPENTVHLKRWELDVHRRQEIRTKCQTLQ